MHENPSKGPSDYSHILTYQTNIIHGTKLLYLKVNKSLTLNHFAL